MTNQQLVQLNECTKALCPSTYCMKVLSLAIDLILRPSFISLVAK